jgi:hypothetical protein
MENNEKFKLIFDSDYFIKGDLLLVSNNIKLEVKEDPHKKWWKILLQFITFGLYKAPYQYKVKLWESTQK